MNPEELIAQITAMIGEYVAGGGDPAMLVEAIGPALEGGGAPPEGPPDADAMGTPPPIDPSMMGAQGGMPDLQGMMPSAPPTSNEGAHPFANASAMAIEDIEKRKRQGR